MKPISLILLLAIITSPLTAQQKTYNIIAYGAKADGKTNNTTAIQSAINKASANAKEYIAFSSIDSLENIPEKTGDYPEFSMFGELPAWGFYVRHADNVKFKNIKLSSTGTEFRTACVFDDMDGLELDGVKITRAASLPVILLNKIKRSSFLRMELPDNSKDAVLVK